MSERPEHRDDFAEARGPRDFWDVIVFLARSTWKTLRFLKPYAREGRGELRAAFRKPENPGLARMIDRALFGRWTKTGFLSFAVGVPTLLVFLHNGFFWKLADYILADGFRPWEMPSSFAGMALDVLIWLLSVFLYPDFLLMLFLAWRFRKLFASDAWRDSIATIPGSGELLFRRLLRLVTICAMAAFVLPYLLFGSWQALQEFRGGEFGLRSLVWFSRSGLVWAWCYHEAVWVLPFIPVLEPIAWASGISITLFHLSLNAMLLLATRRLIAGVGLYVLFQLLDDWVLSWVWWLPYRFMPSGDIALHLVASGSTITPAQLFVYGFLFLVLVGLARRQYDAHGTGLPERYANRAGEG